MGYLVNQAGSNHILQIVSNANLLLWDSSNPIKISKSAGYILSQCTLVYKNATSPLVLAATPEITLIDLVSGNVIQHAFHSGGITLDNDSSIVLKNGNKSNNNVDPYSLSNDLYLSISSNVVSGDGELYIYMFGTY